jgi:hypothetical protein
LKLAAAAAAKKAKENLEKARLEAQKAQIEVQKSKEEVQRIAQLKTRLTVMHGWRRGVALDLIADMADASPNEVRQLIATFEKVKNHCQTNPEPDVKTVTQLSRLNEAEVKILLTFVAG